MGIEKKGKNTVRISGLHCGNCAKTVERAVAGIPGAKVLKTDMANHAVLVHVEDEKSFGKLKEGLPYEVNWVD